MAYKNYDPGLVVITFGSARLTGFMDGSFCTVTRAVDAFETHVGADGDVTRVRSRNKTGTITITLKAESPSNALLSAYARLDELFGTGSGSIRVENLNGIMVAQASNAWIQKRPDQEYSDSATGREWIIACADLDMNDGGAFV